MRVLILALFALLFTVSVASAKTPHTVTTASDASADIRLDQASATDEEDVTSGSDDVAVRSGSDDLALGIDRNNFANGDAEDNGPEAPGALSRDGGFNLAPAQ